MTRKRQLVFLPICVLLLVGADSPTKEVAMYGGTPSRNMVSDETGQIGSGFESLAGFLPGIKHRLAILILATGPASSQHPLEHDEGYDKEKKSHQSGKNLEKHHREPDLLLSRGLSRDKNEW